MVAHRKEEEQRVSAGGPRSRGSGPLCAIQLRRVGKSNMFVILQKKLKIESLQPLLVGREHCAGVPGISGGVCSQLHVAPLCLTADAEVTMLIALSNGTVSVLSSYKWKGHPGRFSGRTTRYAFLYRAFTYANH